jgi:FemAB-related protein (PEP-CTERM system-associated)
MTRVVPWDGDTGRWNAVLERAPDATPYHFAEWHAVMTDTLGHEALYHVAVNDGGAWTGVLPLVRVRTPVLGHFLVSMPFLNAGGPAGEPSATRTLAAWAADEARRARCDLLEMRMRQPLAGRPTTDADPLRLTDRKITVQLDLPATAAELWQRFPAKLRSQVRRPMREGFDVRFGVAELAAFHVVYAHTMHALGTPALPLRFFEAVTGAIARVVEVAVVYRGDEPVAAGFGFLWRDTFELHWAGWSRRWQRAAPNMLLYWALMEQMVARGARRFDFGRCTPGAATHAFKRQWGGVDVALPWLQWSATNRTAPPTADRGAIRFASACWRRLPYAMTARLGPTLARRLP